MARGKVLDKDTQLQIFAALAQGKSVSDVARELELPRSTVQTWEERFVKQSEEIAKRDSKGGEVFVQDDEEKDENELDLVKARERTKKEFVKKMQKFMN